MTWMCAHGHLASTAQLRAHGVNRPQLASAVADGLVYRVERGKYACSHLDAKLRLAASTRTALDCVTALGLDEDQWAGIRTPGLHVRARPGRHTRAIPVGAIVHWSDAVDGWGQPLLMSTVDALLQAMRCLEPYDALACIESARNLGRLNDHQLAHLLGRAPQWMRSHLNRLDFGAGSGVETLPRLWLQDLGHHVETQVSLPGAGRLDLLVDDCVGIEIDGAKWHLDRFMQDRTKDIGIEWWGIRVLRIGYPHVMHTWPRTLATIERMIRDARR